MLNHCVYVRITCILQTTSQLVFAKIRYEAIGRYRCVADNRETDAVMSEYANVRVTRKSNCY